MLKYVIQYNRYNEALTKCAWPLSLRVPPRQRLCRAPVSAEYRDVQAEAGCEEATRALAKGHADLNVAPSAGLPQAGADGPPVQRLPAHERAVAAVRGGVPAAGPTARAGVRRRR